MIRSVLALSLVCLLAIACNKTTSNPEPTSTTPTNNTPTNNTNAVHGDWKLEIYDSATITAPMAATFKATANSTTGGSVKFDITFDGTNHNTEEATYVLSNSNTNIVFNKTGGNYNVLSGGGTWDILEMTATTIRMKSAMNLYIKMTK
ncbi:MAG: hypothetical protein H3C54_15380 [Taibaiella sp.]|nr:hypothetical protein [Taibaiella sp.]